MRSVSMAHLLRHVIGGRPQGWNLLSATTKAVAHRYRLYECLTRTGRCSWFKGADVEPLPNLSKSWNGRMTASG